MDVTAGPAGQTYEFGPFRLDGASRVLLRDNRLVPLPPKVLDTLLLLVRNHGKLVSKDEMLRSVWPDTYVDQSSLMHNISVLRKVLGNDPDGKPYIETVPRRGYRFTAIVRTAANEIAAQTETIRVLRTPSIVAPAGGLLAVLIVAALAMKTAPPGPLRVTPLTSYPGTQAFPTFSPDGRELAFSWNGEKQDQFDIYRKPLGAEAPRRLTSDAASECHLAWSPDGAWIAFIHCGAEAAAPAGKTSLYVIPSGGGPKRRIADIYDGANPFERPFTWTSDSKALISAKGLGGSVEAGLVLLSVETGARIQELTWPQRGSWDSNPTISPDGRTLAFSRWIASGVADIYLLDLNRQFAPRGLPKRLTFQNDFVGNPIWTNNGSELLYLSGSKGNRGVWRVRARIGGHPEQVPALAQASVHLAFSRDGKLAYSRPFWDYAIWRAELDQRGPTHTAGALIASAFSDAEPSYSPDGNSIAFASNRTGAREIWRSNRDGSGATQVTSLRAEAGSPSWSPDGAYIAFDCGLHGNVDIYIVGVFDGKLRRLTMDGEVHTTPSWSHDGKWIYFASKRTGRLEVWKMPAGGGIPLQVTRSGGFFASESSDGRFLFYSKTSAFPTALWRKSLETGREEKIVDSVGNWFYFKVFPDGIYFIPGNSPPSKEASFRVAFYDFSNSTTRTIAEVDRPPGLGFSISSDRRSVLFAPPETHASNLMLIENFR